MDQNQIAHGAFTPEAATDEPASPFHSNETERRPLPPRDGEEFAFATQAEADAYWAGVADGIRNQGGIPTPRLASRARDHYPELVATEEQLRDRDILEFDPVSLRHRIDGFTPAKQREYVEALADSGVARYAAARIGMSEQSVNRLRRRPEAASFNRACEAAHRIGSRRLVSVAFERSIEGTVKRHYYHGEVKSEERVYDNRLLMSLIGKLPHLFEEPGPEPIEQNWQPWMEAIEQGLPEPSGPEPPIAEEPPAAPESGPADASAKCPIHQPFDGHEVWEDDEGIWWTEFLPPDDFDGEEQGRFGTDDYCRTLTEAEQAVIDAEAARERALAAARRDFYFGFAGDNPEAEVFHPQGCEPYETYEPSNAEAGASSLPGHLRAAHGERGCVAQRAEFDMEHAILHPQFVERGWGGAGALGKGAGADLPDRLAGHDMLDVEGIVDMP